MTLLLSAGPLTAQAPVVRRPISVFEASADPPTQLPPLLPVPAVEPGTGTPAPCGPRCDYDHGHLYLPERAPDAPKLPPCPCRPLGRAWLIPSLELGWSRPARLPALARAGSPNGPAVVGGELPAGLQVGFALSAGAWLDRCQNRGIDAGVYYLGDAHACTGVGPTTGPLFLPVPDPSGATPAFPLAGPAAGLGTFTAGLATRFVSADVNYRRTLFCETNTRVDALFGYRYAHVGEDADLYGKRLGPAGEIVRFRDEVSADNQFHGGQVGLAAEYRADDWYVGLVPKVAFGRVTTRTGLDGKFRTDGVVEPFGFYARPGPGGQRDSSRYAVMPTLAVTLGRQVGEHARVFVGYQFQYLTDVTRTDDVIDPVPDLGGGFPRTRRDAGTTSDYWAQSVSLGMEWRY